MHDLRAIVAEAVHNAVVDFTSRNGRGFCQLYAVAGQALADRVFGPGYVVQAGSLRILADPPDGWIALNAAPDGLASGRYHAWFARGGGRDGPLEVVDLSARHYAAWADLNSVVLRTDGRPVRWNWPSTPRYLWLDTLESDWVGLVADPALTTTLAYWANESHDILAPLHQLACQHFLTSKVR